MIEMSIFNDAVNKWSSTLKLTTQFSSHKYETLTLIGIF